MKYKDVMFDWGDTVIIDKPSLNTPVYQWSKIELIEGLKSILKDLSKQQTFLLITNTQVSTESEIKLALRRVEIEKYFTGILCYKNVGLPKTDIKFYQTSIKGLGISSSEIVMIGDNFDTDIKMSNNVGIFGIWYHPNSIEDRQGKLSKTIQRFSELLLLLE